MLIPTTFPRPADLTGAINGMLPGSVLDTVRAAEGWSDELHHEAAQAWNRLVAAAAGAGFQLTFTDCYRDVRAQEILFRARFTVIPTPGQPTVIWQGRTWWLRKDPATGRSLAWANRPGTSNHGWGLAVDAARAVLGSKAQPFTASMFEWLEAMAPTFGWVWENPKEPWHLVYIGAPTPTAPPVGASTEEDMPLIVHGDGPGRPNNTPPTAEEVTGNGWAWAEIIRGTKRWISRNEADVLEAAGITARAVPQAKLDAMPWDRSSLAG